MERNVNATPEPRIPAHVARTPLCIIETESADVVPFNGVTAEFAASEGEGARVLARGAP